jgi:hypothetical protein
MPTQRELATADERRARIIAQLHEQAIATANLWALHKVIGADIVKAARRRRTEAWFFVVGTVLLVLGCIFVGGWIVALAL